MIELFAKIANICSQLWSRLDCLLLTRCSGLNERDKLKSVQKYLTAELKIGITFRIFIA